MLEEASPVDISFNNIRINSMISGSGVFAGSNIQYLWYSDETTISGFGTVAGEDNTLKSPCNAVTDPSSCSELLEYFEEQVRIRIRKWGM
ncbi:MAG: hypothetical protein APF77_19915 [Clostridia bacterium BRH_c25]|nr:MAG: hypothetical protein APF77_19915 [Clostridia bacterium BRH_c25]